MSAIGADRERELTALEMAQNAAAAVVGLARAAEADPVAAHIGRAGDRGHASAQLAGAMALVSIAEDLHCLVGIMTRRVGYVGEPEPVIGPEDDDDERDDDDRDDDDRDDDELPF